MVEDIKLIKNWDVAHFQDTLLITFWWYMTVEIENLLASQGSANVDESEGSASQGSANVDESENSPSQPVGELPAKLVAAAEELLAAITAMNEAFTIINTKELSAEIKRKDEERDNLLRGVKQMVKAMVMLSPTEEQHAAAEALQQSIDDWGLDPRQAYVLESTVVVEWLKVVAESEELTRAAELLGLTDSLRRLGGLCEEVDALIGERNAEFVRKHSMQQRQRRKEAEARWRTFVLVLNAAAVMDPDEQRYESFVRVVNLELKNLKRQMRHTRRMNPRKRGAEDSRLK